jgi:SAM-dependent methyltransferase
MLDLRVAINYNFKRMSLLKHRFKNDIDSPERTLEHKELILTKSFLKRIYLDWYAWFLKKMPEFSDGPVIELGSGGGFLKELAPAIISSDILNLPGNDMCFSALDMPFKDNEISGIVMIDTFHHIPDIEKFLTEANRVLKRRAGIMMVEPANSLWGRFIYKNFHHEPFYPDGGWQIETSGPLSGANGALPWIVFERDKQKFNQLFPDFKIISIEYHSPFKYLISGGVSYKQLLPGVFYPAVNLFEKLLTMLSKHFSMFVSIHIEKL